MRRALVVAILLAGCTAPAEPAVVVYQAPLPPPTWPLQHEITDEATSCMIWPALPCIVNRWFVHTPPGQEPRSGAFQLEVAADRTLGLEPPEVHWAIIAGPPDNQGPFQVLAEVTGNAPLELSLDKIRLAPGERLGHEVTIGDAAHDGIGYPVHVISDLVVRNASRIQVRSESVDVEARGLTGPCAWFVESGCDSPYTGTHIEAILGGRMTTVNATVTWSAATPATAELQLVISCRPAGNSPWCHDFEDIVVSGVSPLVFKSDDLGLMGAGRSLDVFVESDPIGVRQSYELDLRYVHEYEVVEGSVWDRED